MKHPVVPLTFFWILCWVSLLYSDPTILLIRLAGKFILVEGAVVDEQSGYFILDTGVSGLVLNARHFKGKASREMAATGINGNPVDVQTLYVHFKLGNEEWKDQHATLIPLDHLETAKNVEILGLVGGALFWKYEMMIDFNRMEVQLQEAGKNDLSLMESNPFEDVLPFRLKGGMPCVEVRLGDQTFCLALDTAAEDNFLNQDNWGPLDPWITERKFKSFRGISRDIRQAKAAYLERVQVGNFLCIPMSTLFADLDEVNRNLTGQKIDGLLGFELLKQFRVAIHFKDKKIGLSAHRPTAISAILAKAEQQGEKPDPMHWNSQASPVLLAPQHGRKQ